MDEPEAHISSPLQKRAEKDPQFAEEMWRFRHPEEGGEKLTLEAILVECPLRYGITVGSLDTLSRFYRWLKVKREAREKRDAIYAIKEELSKDPEISEEELERKQRIMFLTDSWVQKDPKVFEAMVRLRQGDKSLAQRDKQLRQRDKEITQREKLVQQSERKLAMLEAKAARLDALEAKAKELKQGGGLSAETLEMLEGQLKIL